jgi:hypothetical protein
LSGEGEGKSAGAAAAGAACYGEIADVGHVGSEIGGACQTGDEEVR